LALGPQTVCSFLRGVSKRIDAVVSTASFEDEGEDEGEDEDEDEDERRTTNDEPRTTNDERRTTNDERRTTNELCWIVPIRSREENARRR